MSVRCALRLVLKPTYTNSCRSLISDENTEKSKSTPRKRAAGAADGESPSKAAKGKVTKGKGAKAKATEGEDEETSATKEVKKEETEEDELA